MSFEKHQQSSLLYSRATRLSAAAAIAGGSMVMLGWLLDISALKRILPGLVTMKANTAATFILAGVSLWHASAETRSKRSRLVSALCATGVMLVGLLVCLEYFANLDIGIDQLLIRESTVLPGDIPGRMGLVTAINFSLLGVTLLLLGQDRMPTAMHGLAIAIGAFAASALVGYAYATEELYRIRHAYTAMALHTGAIFLVIVFGIINARAHFPFRRIMGSQSAAGVATRQLLVAAIIVPFATGWLVMGGYRVGYFGEALALSIFAVTNMAALGLLVLWNSAFLFKAELMRKRAEDELRRHELQLEEIVARRTEELNTANAALEQQARYDYLTGLYNRRYFMELAEMELIRTQRYATPLAVLILDIDHFKSINDSYGHQGGDSVLRKLAGLLCESLREIDVIGRIGGEEFAVVLSQTNLEKAVEAAERMRSLLMNTTIAISERQSISCTASFGVATLTSGDTGIAALLHRADLALYESKRSGRNQVSVG